MAPRQEISGLPSPLCKTMLPLIKYDATTFSLAASSSVAFYLEDFSPQAVTWLFLLVKLLAVGTSHVWNSRVTIVAPCLESQTEGTGSWNLLISSWLGLPDLATFPVAANIERHWPLASFALLSMGLTKNQAASILAVSFYAYPTSVYCCFPVSLLARYLQLWLQTQCV